MFHHMFLRFWNQLTIPVNVAQKTQKHILNSRYHDLRRHMIPLQKQPQKTDINSILYPHRKDCNSRPNLLRGRLTIIDLRATIGRVSMIIARMNKVHEQQQASP